jgi:hypothetical protein
MKLEVPYQFSGYACVTEEGDVCFGEDKVECDACPNRKENECSPVMIEIIPTDDWADRQMHVEATNTTHQAYKEALDRLKVDVQDLKKSLENVGKVE